MIKMYNVINIHVILFFLSCDFVAATPSFPSLPTVVERVGVEWEMENDSSRLSFVGQFLNLLVTLVYSRTLPHDYDISGKTYAEIGDIGKTEQKDEIPGFFLFCFRFFLNVIIFF
jgi:hypothetical protein